jgi:hypothetical protein
MYIYIHGALVLLLALRQRVKENTPDMTFITSELVCMLVYTFKDPSG